MFIKMTGECAKIRISHFETQKLKKNLPGALPDIHPPGDTPSPYTTSILLAPAAPPFSAPGPRMSILYAHAHVPEQNDECSWKCLEVIVSMYRRFRVQSYFTENLR